MSENSKIESADHEEKFCFVGIEALNQELTDLSCWGNERLGRFIVAATSRDDRTIIRRHERGFTVTTQGPKPGQFGLHTVRYERYFIKDDEQTRAWERERNSWDDCDRRRECALQDALILAQDAISRASNSSGGSNDSAPPPTIQS